MALLLPDMFCMHCGPVVPLKALHRSTYILYACNVAYYIYFK